MHTGFLQFFLLSGKTLAFSCAQYSSLWSCSWCSSWNRFALAPRHCVSAIWSYLLLSICTSVPASDPLLLTAEPDSAWTLPVLTPGLPLDYSSALLPKSSALLLPTLAYHLTIPLPAICVLICSNIANPDCLTLSWPASAPTDPCLLLAWSFHLCASLQSPLHVTVQICICWQKTLRALMPLCALAIPCCLTRTSELER